MECTERFWIRTNAFGQKIVDIKPFDLTTITNISFQHADSDSEIFCRYFSQPMDSNPRLLVVSAFEDEDQRVPLVHVSLEVIIRGTRRAPRPFQTVSSQIRPRIEYLERALDLTIENQPRFIRSSGASPDSPVPSEKDKDLRRNLFASTTRTPPNEIGR